MTWDELQTEIRTRAKAQPRGFSADLAKTLNMSKPQVSHFLSGRRSIPLEHLDTILRLLNLELVLQVRTPSASTERAA